MTSYCVIHYMKHLFMLVCLCSSAILFGQQATQDEVSDSVASAIDTTVFPFVAYWAVGDTYHYEVTKLETREVNGVVTKADTNIYRSRLDIVDSTANSYLLRYTIGETITANTPELSIPMMESLMQFYHLESITYRTDELGTFQRLENWQEFAVAMDTVFELIIQEFVREKGADESVLRRTMQPMRDIYTSESGILNKIINEVPYLHFPFGLEYTLGDTARYNTGLPNLFGSKPIDTENTLFIEEAHWQEDYVELRHYTNLTPDGESTLRQAIIGAFPGVTDNPQMQEALASASVTLEDDNWYAYYNYPGIPIQIDNDRYLTVVIGDETSIQHNKIVIRWTD